jgi:signal transduction histidine kinase
MVGQDRRRKERSVAIARPAQAGSGSRRAARVRASLWVVGGLVGVSGLLLIATAPDISAGERALGLAIVLLGCSFLGCGLVAWAQRPEKRLGRLMVLLGAVWLGAIVAQVSEVGVVATLGVVVLDGWVILLVFFLISFPSGRLTSRTDWLLVAPYALAAGPLNVTWLLFHEFDPDEPDNALLIWPNETVADAIDVAQRVIYVSATFVVVAVLARRWRAASPPLRRGMTPILAGAAALLISNVQLVLARLADVETYVWVQTAMIVVITAVPYAVLVDMLRARLARSAVGDLVLALHASPAPEDLRAAIAQALGDPSLAVAYWLPDQEGYVDLEGRPVALPDDPARRTNVVDGSRTPVAALLHDPSLQEHPALLDAVGAAAGLALERARLHAELHARLDELRSTRGRIFEAAQSERRRLERDLHDGAQQRLVTLGLDLGMLERRLGDDPEARRALEQARGELQVSLDELRELARGIHPAVVTGRGLRAALEGLAVRAPLPVRLSVTIPDRPPEQVEVAVYFMVSECLTNVAKYAHASAASVDVAATNGELVVEVADDGVGGAEGNGGSGLRGLADRVEALGGRFAVTSPAGDGTCVRAEIPCG